MYAYGASLGHDHRRIVAEDQSASASEFDFNGSGRHGGRCLRFELEHVAVRHRSRAHSDACTVARGATGGMRSWKAQATQGCKRQAGTAAYMALPTCPSVCLSASSACKQKQPSAYRRMRTRSGLAAFPLQFGPVLTSGVPCRGCLGGSVSTPSPLGPAIRSELSHAPTGARLRSSRRVQPAVRAVAR